MPMQAGTIPGANTTPEKPPDGAWRLAHRLAVPPPPPPSHRMSGHPRAQHDHTPDRSDQLNPDARPPSPELPHHRPAACQSCAPNPNSRRAADRQGPKQPAARMDASGSGPTPIGTPYDIARPPNY